MGNDNEVVEACPRNSGITVGYIVERKDINGIWCEIETKETQGNGITRSHHNTQILEINGMMGYQAAMAVAWTYKANDTILSSLGVRIVPFKIKYEINAWLQDERIQEVGGIHKKQHEDKLQ